MTIPTAMPIYSDLVVNLMQNALPGSINLLIFGHTSSQRSENWHCFWCKSADEGKIGCPPCFQSKDLLEFKHKDELASSFLISVYMNQVDRLLIQDGKKNNSRKEWKKKFTTRLSLNCSASVGQISFSFTASFINNCQEITRSSI